MSPEALPSAAVTLEEIVAQDPSTALYLPVAERLLSMGHVPQAILLCEERRSRPGKGIGDHIVLGRCYLADGRLDQASQEFRRALALDRENVVALKSLAGILSHEGRHDEAADLYRAVCRVDPGDLESQSALHQITSGEYPEVRPAEVIVSQTEHSWQPVRLTREEDHLSELGMGLPTFDSLDAPASARAPVRGVLGPEAPPREASPAEPLLSPGELSLGPSFPHEREEAAPPAAERRPQPSRHEVIPASTSNVEGGGLHDRLGSLEASDFQSSALERLDQVLRPAMVRPLGEVESVAEAPGPAAAAAPAAAKETNVAAPATERRSAVWRDEPVPAKEPAMPAEPVVPRGVEPAEPKAVEPANAAPANAAPEAAPPEPELDPAVRPRVEGNRSAFEDWVRRMGGNP